MHLLFVELRNSQGKRKGYAGFHLEKWARGGKTILVKKWGGGGGGKGSAHDSTPSSGVMPTPGKI